MDDFFRALADSTRRKLLVAIRDRESVCVCELGDLLAESQPKISRHLALLRSADLVEAERRGQWVHYRLCGNLSESQRQMIDLLEEHVPSDAQPSPTHCNE